MNKTELEKMAEVLPRVWVDQGIEILKQRDGSYEAYIQERRGFILSGAGGVVNGEYENQFKLEARYVPSEKTLKFRIYIQKPGTFQWQNLGVNNENKIPPYGMKHYIENVEPKDADSEVSKYFSEFTRLVQLGNTNP